MASDDDYDYVPDGYEPTLTKLIRERDEAQADNDALRARLAVVEAERDEIGRSLDSALAMSIKARSEGYDSRDKLRARLAAVMPIVEYVASEYGVVGVHLPEISAQARAWLARFR